MAGSPVMVFESEAVRRLVGRLARGERLPESFRTVAAEKRVRTAWISALGALEWVELVEYDQDRKVYRSSRRIDRQAEILSLVGNVSFMKAEPFVHLHATVSYETEQGIEVVGGHLTDAQVFACEFVMECFDDLRLQREHDDTTGLSLWMVSPAARAPELARPPDGHAAIPPAGPAPISWTHVVRASEQADVPRQADVRPARIGREQRPEPKTPRVTTFRPSPIPSRQKTSEEEFFGEPIPGKGEFVDHRQFGLCRVDGEDAEGGLVIRLPNGRRKVIRLDYLTVLPPEIRDDKTVYRLEPKKKGD
jgi:predicted DNA-binding protein with PD1-like motif